MLYRKNIIQKLLTTITLIGALAHFAILARAEENPPTPSPSTDGKERNFYEVLEDVVGDFEYDLKNGNVNGIKDVSIRNIALSENVPPSFKSHLELLITERIIRNTKARVIQCLACKARKTTMNGDQVTISATDQNPAELARVAKAAGIANFMDVSFAYQPNGMILSMFIADPDSGSVVWSHSYNSETSRASANRRGVDFSQNDEARKTSEYTPIIQYRPTLYYLFEPNVGATTGVLGLGMRVVERYDNRKKEVGFEMNYFLDASSLSGNPGTPGVTNLYSGFNITLLFVHAWNLIGEEENFNRMRGSIFLGVGGTYGSGFLGALVRTGYDWRLGKHYAVSANLGYRPQATPFVGNVALPAVSGVEFGLGISALF